MKIGFLTSSRSDYSLYKPLLELMRNDNYFEVEIIVFGANLSRKYGLEINNIILDNYGVIHKVVTNPDGDTPLDISKSMALTVRKFSKFWFENDFHLLIALGDRYEMFSSIISSIPFNIKIAHISGGEVTTGAFDNIFRNCITNSSHIHFTSTRDYKNRVIQLINSDKNVFNVGALGIDNLSRLKLYSVKEFYSVFNVNLKLPTILVTFHPETVEYKNNEFYVKELISALSSIEGYQIIITMPNADTNGILIRNYLLDFIKNKSNVFGFESLGTKGYLSAIKLCNMMLGNSSSGFVEAYFFKRYVINIGERQKGRIHTENMINIPIKKNEIINAIDNHKNYVNKIVSNKDFYGKGNAAKKIIEKIKKIKKHNSNFFYGD
tara:strand:- start:98 stop:1234 length:1137 start_codon:yes stop_codon:yes gene_type:complete